MSFVAWIFVGLVAGYVSHKLVQRRDDGILLHALIGLIGALAGGFVFQLASVSEVRTFNLLGTLIAATGAVVLLVGFQAIRLVRTGTR